MNTGREVVTAGGVEAKSPLTDGVVAAAAGVLEEGLIADGGVVEAGVICRVPEPISA